MKMKMKWWSLVCIAAGLIASFIVYPDMPDRLPIHWGISGEPNQFADKNIALFIVPVLLAVVFVLTEFRDKLDSGKKNAALNRPIVAIIRNAISFALLLLQAYTIYYGYGKELPISKVAAVVLGFIFIVTGNYMPRLRQNRFAGIRTRLTLTDPDAWRKANAIGGKYFVIGGVLILLSVFVPEYLQVSVILILLVLIVLAQIYSVWRASRTN